MHVQMCSSRASKSPTRRFEVNGQTAAASSPARARAFMYLWAVETILLHGEECAQYAYVDVVSSGKRARRAPL
jgi:hypothetical protein